MDIKKLSMKHVFFQGLKWGAVFGTYYCSVLYLIVRDLNLRARSKVKNILQYEIMERNSILS